MNNDHLKKPLVLVIFGITGDLAQRKLLPALYQLLKANELPEQFRIVGISRRAVEKDTVYEQLGSFVGEANFEDIIRERLMDATEMHQMDLLDAESYRTLLWRLGAIENDYPAGSSRLYYLSIPSQAFQPIIRLLGQTGHNAPLPNSSDAPRLLIEKPFGYDLVSAKELIAVLEEHFGEGQVYRIDHYVAKETVQNMLTFRFKNPLFENDWDNQHIASIHIRALESIGIEGRASFYEQTGALRDLIQSHLLQLLAITTMARPAQLDSDNIHAEKLRLLQAIRPIAPDRVSEDAVRGQYRGYKDEVSNQDSLTETYARLHLSIEDDTWRGVDVTLETGKAMHEKVTDVTVDFKAPSNDETAHNQLIFRIQPREGITLCLQTKRPGIYNETEEADMNFDYAHAFDQRPAEAYERVIIDAIRGDQTLFASAAEVIRSWEIVENVLQQWSHGPSGLNEYDQGSHGPANL